MPGWAAGAGPHRLRLQVQEFADLTSWRWVLIDEAVGTDVATHDVLLDPADWQFEAFGDLHHYLTWHVAPDRRGTDDERIVCEVGEWIGEKVLGPVADELARRARERHLTVRVVIPADATDLLLAPLELAHVGGRPLAVQDVTFVLQPGPEEPRAEGTAYRDRLRVLGLFSLPQSGQPLNLRRERQALVTLIRGIAAAGKAVDVRVLQYGVTRDLLRDVLAEGEGWDVIHISGHGAPGELLLETADGAPDRVDAATLTGLLMAAREHVRLITVTACWSAALTVAEQRRRLGVPVEDQRTESPGAKRTHPPVPPSRPSRTLATELARRLGCAVLAMRYPVDDRFAIALTMMLYHGLLAKGQPLPRAVGTTLRELSSPASGSPAPAYPALSVVTPALFGGTAVGLSLRAPDRSDPAGYDSGRLKMAGFPPQPERFVGRAVVMARSSAALALRSGIPGVLLHGMPGGGKTACALELAYGHEHAFDRLVWYKAPDEGMDITGALADFAFTLERGLPGFEMIDVLADTEKLHGFLPRLTELAEQRRMLLVIDNAESLLTEGGEWRDAQWGQVIGALTAHKGLGRVIVTSRRVPADLTGLQVAVDVLSADEALLFARELPHLQALGAGKVPGISLLHARRLTRRALEIAHGHPKLLELAEGQAANPERLAALLAAGDKAWAEQGGLPDGFFTTETVTPHTSGIAAAAEDYWHVLAAWTRSVADALAPGERDLFWLLCCLEEPDRTRPVLGGNWAGLWRRLGRDGEPPDLDQALPAITARGLAGIRTATADGSTAYPVHPAVAEAGRRHAGKPFRDAADTEAAAYWTFAHELAFAETGDGTVDTRLLVRAGLAAIPYLTRQERWDDAAPLLEAAFALDPSRANAAAVLPAIAQITHHDPSSSVILARVLMVIDPDAAYRRLLVDQVVATVCGDYLWASVAAGGLFEVYRDAGRLDQALDMARQQAKYTRRAGLGPWTRLYNDVRRLQVLAMRGDARRVLGKVGRLRARMATLSATDGPDEIVPPWQVRETLLETGRLAATLLGRYADALAFTAEMVASLDSRHAPATYVALARFHDYGPLLGLGRAEEALQLLRDCRRIFQDSNASFAFDKIFGGTLSALADTEDARGHGDAAIRLECDALRYLYLARDPFGLAGSHHNLGLYLRRHARQPALALASHLTAALIRTLTGTAGNEDPLGAAAASLRELGTAAVLPANVADLCRQVDDIPGTDLGGLLASLSPDSKATEAALRSLVAQALAMARPSWRHRSRRGRSGWGFGSRI